MPYLSVVRMSKITDLTNLLHLARKAGKVKIGMSLSCSSCIKNRASLVLCAEDISNNSKDKIEKIARQKNVRFIVYGSKKLFSDIFNRTVTGIISIEDKNFASGILMILG